MQFGADLLAQVKKRNGPVAFRPSLAAGLALSNLAIYREATTYIFRLSPIGPVVNTLFSPRTVHLAFHYAHLIRAE